MPIPRQRCVEPVSVDRPSTTNGWLRRWRRRTFPQPEPRSRGFHVGRCLSGSAGLWVAVALPRPDHAPTLMSAFADDQWNEPSGHSLEHSREASAPEFLRFRLLLPAEALSDGMRSAKNLSMSLPILESIELWWKPDCATGPARRHQLGPITDFLPEA